MTLNVLQTREDMQNQHFPRVVNTNLEQTRGTCADGCLEQILWGSVRAVHNDLATMLGTKHIFFF